MKNRKALFLFQMMINNHKNKQWTLQKHKFLDIIVKMKTNMLSPKIM